MDLDDNVTTDLKAARKREKIIQRAESFKSTLRKWEAAVAKAEGRKPGKEDLKRAPDSVQKAYREYYKLVKYLQSGSSSSRKASSAKKSSQGPSPKKIFGYKSYQLGKPVNPATANMGNPTPTTSTGAEKSAASKKSNLKNSNANSSRKVSGGGITFNLFAEKIRSVINVFSNSSPKKRQCTLKVVNKETGQDEIRNVLIPNRSAKVKAHCSGTTNDTNELKEMEIDDPPDPNPKTKPPSNAFLDEADEIHFADIIGRSSSKEQDPTGGNQISAKLNSVSAIWQNISPNPKCGNKESKQVDFAWLSRCGRRNSNSNTDTDNFEMDDGFGMDDSGHGHQAEEPLFSKKFRNFLASTESEIDIPNANQNYLGQDSVGTEKSGSSADHEIYDSGLGLSSFVLSTEDILDVVQTEILPRTLEENIFQSEDACSPPDTPFNTIDMDVIRICINHSPAPAPENKKESESSNSTDARLNEGVGTRKRKAWQTFTPSPKKPETKKFFKSRTRERQPRYSVQSYKPLTPVKKTVSKSTGKKDTKLKSESAQTTTPTPTVPSGSNITAKRSSKAKEPIGAGTSKSLRKLTGSMSKAVPSNDLVGNENHTESNTATSKIDYFDEAVQPQTSSKQNKKKRKYGREHLESKAKDGKMNENFVRIDITKKVFVRGRKRMSGAKVKRNDWKQKKASASKEEKLKSLVCRKCGEPGHFRKFCMKDSETAEQSKVEDESPFPSLEEAAKMVMNRSTAQTHRVNVFDATVASTDELPPNEEKENSMEEEECPVDVDEQIDDPLLKIPKSNNQTTQRSLSPYFEMDSLSEDEDTVLQKAICKFGYGSFRPGQKEAVSRILKGQSTLCVLSTGSGKSLCYQLPAYLYAKKYPGAIVICVSPLVSLMEDQVVGIPPFMQAAFLHSNMSSVQKEKVLDKIRSKKLHILLVSPEAVCGGLFGILRGQDLPEISFACIDEVHCVSQWSHNFRPCYLQLAKILREKLRVTTVLGLTATATEYTANSICQTLRIDPSTTIRGEIIPLNLNLSVSRDTYRDEALLGLLAGERLRECESVIIYCTRRDECQRIACLIRTNLQDIPGFNGVTKTNLRQRVSNTCEAYHAGMTAGRRRLVQQHFMSGKIRIVVATVAFGMGIDKSDIRAVIHYNMPKTFESYVQEIGRAGRDGLPAHCHLFLDSVKGRDLSELKRHVYSNSIDRTTLRKLLRKVFQGCKCERMVELRQASTARRNKTQVKRRCPGHEVSFSIDEAVNELDMAQENITTILCYLELDPTRKWVELLPHTYQTCKIHSYGGAALLKSAAMKCPPLAAAIALKKEKHKFKDSDVYLEFNVIEVAATLGWNSPVVKKELKNLEWTGTNFDDKGNASRFRKSGILVEFEDLAFHATAPGDPTDEESDTVLSYLHNHNLEQEKSQLYQLHRVYQSLLSVSYTNVESVCDDFDEEKSNALKKFIETYFFQKTMGVPPEWTNDISYSEEKEEDIRRDIRDLLASVTDAQFTGRSIAKILQGIPSPSFPAETWGRNRSFWRKHLDCDFHFLCKIAGQEILRF